MKIIFILLIVLGALTGCKKDFDLDEHLRVSEENLNGPTKELELGYVSDNGRGDILFPDEIMRIVSRPDVDGWHIVIFLKRSFEEYINTDGLLRITGTLFLGPDDEDKLSLELSAGLFTKNMIGLGPLTNEEKSKILSRIQPMP